MKTTLIVSCVNQNLISEKIPQIYSGGNNENIVHFSFCELWDDFVKTAVFYRTEDEVYHVVLDENNSVIVPWEVTKDSGTFNLGVFGVLGDILRTSSIIAINVSKGAITEGTIPSDPTPDIYQQILSRLNSMESGNLSEEAIEEAIEDYFSKNPPETGNVSDEQIEEAVENYFSENPVGDGSSPTIDLIERAPNLGSNDPGGVEIKVTNPNGTTQTEMIRNGVNGRNGTDGKSVTITDISQSMGNGTSGGYTTITFSDGSKITVYNGNHGTSGANGISPHIGENGNWYIGAVDTGVKAQGENGQAGTTGKDGTSVTISSVTESTEDGGNNTVTFSDGKKLTVKNGKTGANGKDGSDANVTSETIESALGYVPANETIVNQLFATIADNANIASSAYAPFPQLPANGQKAGGGGESTPNFENVIDPATCTLNKRISSTGAEKDAPGDISTDYIPVKSTDTIYINLPLANLNRDYSRVKFYNGQPGNYTFISSSDARIGAQFTVVEEEGVCKFALNSYNGNAIGTSYTAIRLVLDIKDTSEVFADDISGLIVAINEPIAYTEAPEDSANAVGVSADFDGNKVTAKDIYDYMDDLVEKYPRLITKEIVGKDASGEYDWCRYVFGRHAYRAWMRQNYPPMYAWVNGSNIIYSESVSPRIGDTMYSTKYIGTIKGEVSAVNNANQTRIIDNVVYTRDKTKDVDATLVYTEAAYSTKYIGTYANHKNEVSKDVDGVKTRVGAITAMSEDTMSCNDGRTYIRYPLGDRDENYQLKPTIILGANEHGLNNDGSGDASEPAIITARLAKDLCECDPRHTFLNMLRDGYKIVFVPVINPYGFTNGVYTNFNNVNIDRNFDTPGWGKDTVDTRHGVYGGSENETQYWMNSCVASKAFIGMANHSYGRKIGTDTGEIVTAGTCGCMIPRPTAKYDKFIERIEMIMAGYDLSLIFSNSALPEECAKTRSYMDFIGISCCALEMQVSEGFILHGGGQMYTERVMEANYTLLLQFLYMLIKNA